MRGTVAEVLGIEQTNNKNMLSGAERLVKNLVKSRKLYTIGVRQNIDWETNKGYINAGGGTCSLWHCGKRWKGMAQGKLDGPGGDGAKPGGGRGKHSLKWGRGSASGKKSME